MAFADLNIHIQTALPRKSKLQSVFVDMENGFPRIW